MRTSPYPPSGKYGAIFVAVWVVASSLVSLQAQLFGGGGLFNREPEAPRTPTREEIGVPTPVTGRVEAMKGMEVQFELRAESKTPAAAVEFLIRTFPSAGKIVSLQAIPNRRNAALVTYYADPNSSAESDAFAFAVRYRGGRYSSEMRYDIDLVDRKSEISVPAEIDFGEVNVGGEVVREILVRNLGSGPYEQVLLAAPPFHLVDPVDGKLSLSGREVKTVKVAFRPRMLGSTNYFLAFGRSKSGTTKLIGAGSDPFQLVTETVELVLNEESGRREGVVTVQNPGEKPVRVGARGSGRLEKSLLEEYFLAPGKATEIRVALEPNDTAPFDGMVQLYLENGYTKTAQVVSQVVPGRLEISIPGSVTTEVINFGQVGAGRRAEREIEIWNPGGVAVPLEFHVPEPFRLANDPGLSLAPGSAVRVNLELLPGSSDRGAVDSTMNVFGNDQTHSIRLLANVVDSGGTSSASSRPAASGLPLAGMRMRSGNAPVAAAGSSKGQSGGTSPATVEEENDSVTPVASDQKAVVGSGRSADGAGQFEVGGSAPWWNGLDDETLELLRSPLGNIMAPLARREINPDIRNPEDLSVLSAKSDSILLAWTAPKDSSLHSFEVEVGGMGTDSQTAEPVHLWIPYDQVEIDRIDRLVKAKVKGLVPNSTYEFRVVTLDENGRSSLPSEATFATTELPMDWTYIYLGLGLGLLGLLGWGVVKVIRDRQGEIYQAQYVDL